VVASCRHRSAPQAGADAALWHRCPAAGRVITSAAATLRQPIASRLGGLDPSGIAKEPNVLAYDYPLLGVFWSLAILFMFVIVGFIVVYTLVDNLRRADHSGLAKAGWTLLIVVIPLLGALVYILSRPEMANPPLRPAV
jgi:hypothetical protein